MPPTRRRTRPSGTGCPDHPEGSHTWESRGLDSRPGETAPNDRLVIVRGCVKCPAVQSKPYGSRRAWKDEVR